MTKHSAPTVFGHEKRDGYVRGIIAHREILPVFETKKDILHMFSSDNVNSSFVE